MYLTSHHKKIPPPDVTKSDMSPPLAPKKLKEDGPWAAKKKIPGWILNGIVRTIQLPSTNTIN